MDKEQFNKEFAEIQAMAEEKAKALTAQLGKEVTPMAFYVDRFVVGYLTEPSRQVKMQAIDMYERSRTQAGDIVLRQCLIKDESDKAILDESPSSDAIYLGAIDFACRLVKEATELLKKK